MGKPKRIFTEEEISGIISLYKDNISITNISKIYKISKENIRKILDNNNMSSRIELYNQNPNKCLMCDNILSYDKRNNKFCCRKCSSIYNNGKRKEIDDYYNARHCPVCGKKLTWKMINYCSNECRLIDYWDKELKNLKDGNYKRDRRALRNCLMKYFENTCSCCGNNKWMGKDIPLEVHHKDGDSENNILDNLELLCPNCHALTPTYKGKNFGNGRHKRRERYADGKSY